MSKLQYDEIKTIITERFGFKTLEDYRLHLKNSKASPTTEEIELLSPDNINCIDFWRVCDDLFSTDPVCNVSNPDPRYRGMALPGFVLDANRQNFWLAKSLGMIHYIDEFAGFSQLRILEIGAGYGCIRNYVEATTKNQYYGYDVIPRNHNINQLTEEGMFKPDIASLYNTIQTVIMSNTFQHLSDRQRLHYFQEVYKLLIPGGIFVFCGMYNNGAANGRYHANGKAYALHYGQYTPVPTIPQLLETIKTEGYRVHMQTFRWDSIFSFVIQKPYDL